MPSHGPVISNSNPTIAVSTVITTTVTLILILVCLIVAIGISLAIYKKIKTDIDDHIYETPGFAMSTFGFRMNMAPDVLTKNSAYGLPSTAYDDDKAYENVVADVRTLESRNRAYGLLPNDDKTYQNIVSDFRILII